MSDFWKATLEAALWTAIEAFVATFAAGFVAIPEFDWKATGTLAASAGVAALAAAVSVVKSVIVRNLGEKDSIFLAS